MTKRRPSGERSGMSSLERRAKRLGLKPFATTYDPAVVREPGIPSWNDRHVCSDECTAECHVIVLNTNPGDVILGPVAGRDSR
jgi:hypothetical protein